MQTQDHLFWRSKETIWGTSSGTKPGWRWRQIPFQVWPPYLNRFVQPDKPASLEVYSDEMVSQQCPPPPQDTYQIKRRTCALRWDHTTLLLHMRDHGLLHPQQLHLLSRQLEDPDGSFSNALRWVDWAGTETRKSYLEHCSTGIAKTGMVCPMLSLQSTTQLPIYEKCLFIKL